MDLEEETDNGETAALCPDDLKLQQVSFAYEKEKYVLKRCGYFVCKRQ